MPSTAIITDTDASLPDKVAARYGIRQVPIAVHFGDETFLTGLDIDDTSLFERVDQHGQLPTTSAPAPGDFLAAFNASFDEGADEVICFCVSSEISATFDAARTARDHLLDREITVVDTRSISIGQGFMVLEAAEAAQRGGPTSEIIQRALDVGRRTCLYAALSTLKYLAMSGRVGHLTAGMASLLSIKPILTLEDGELQMLERVRSQRKAWSRVIDLTRDALDGRTAERMAIIHVDALEEAQQFEGLLRESLSCPGTILTADLTPGLSVHTGAGLVGVAAVAAT
ncbi:MAG: DegV family protein [Anaerolineae bacterium]|jgi:DegV family protein with EDD domain